MVETLNPRNDVVFKLLFADLRNRDLLVSLLNAVLQPARPIASVQVVNPEIQKDAADDRGLTLDILATHDDDTRTDVEMQAGDRGATEKRALYHWARTYRDGIGRGDDFAELYPCRVIFILAYRLLPGTRMHSTFRVLEVHDGTLLSEDLEIHTVELPKLANGKPLDPAEQAAYDWAKFLAAHTDEERRRLAMANPDISKANDALTRLSQDPLAQQLARWREDELRLQRVELTAMERRGREAGRKAGHEEGHKAGQEVGQRRLVQRQLEKKFGALQEAFIARLEAADLPTLEQYADRVLSATSLAEVFEQ